MLEHLFLSYAFIGFPQNKAWIIANSLECWYCEKSRMLVAHEQFWYALNRLISSFLNNIWRHLYVARGKTFHGIMLAKASKYFIHNSIYCNRNEFQLWVSYSNQWMKWGLAITKITTSKCYTSNDPLATKGIWLGILKFLILKPIYMVYDCKQVIIWKMQLLTISFLHSTHRFVHMAIII